MSATNKKDITIIIVTYKSAHIIGKVLKNIVNKGYKIVIVDNGSNDNLKQYLQNNFHNTGIKLIALKNNIGFGRANNLALKDVITNYAFLLNPDAIISEESIDNLVKEAKKDTKIAICGPIPVKENNPKKQDLEAAINQYQNISRMDSKNKKLYNRTLSAADICCLF